MTNGVGHGDNQRKPTSMEDRGGEDDGRLSSPSVARNRDVIRDAFLSVMPTQGRILEIASGTGEHAIHIVGSSPDLTWVTSDLDAQSRRSIAAWIKDANLGDRISDPIIIDAGSDDWGVSGLFDGIFCCNMVHIAPWSAGRGLLKGASRYLRPGGRVFLYGPFSRQGAHTSESNASFDLSLRSRDQEWGVRDLEGDVLPVAEQVGLALIEARPMPSNNFVVVFEKA